ncbi:glycosyltransferase [Ruegeria profundi]|uniref:Erythromycin biosynthesis protein CIII-like C-terminal domain-containing protein n=1 Tax=Ruegeria profundi TaxID=1685378 RepID=A0A0X3TVP2_9RHOB|nr:glycosyltransferase [Ruegeria profundi]KUJ79749.1 hypothetical protein AVO44_06100 [Ruegeria profundi]
MLKRLAIVSSGLNSPLSSALEFAKQAKSLGYEVRLFAPNFSAELIAHFGLDHCEFPMPCLDAFAPLLSHEELQALSPKDRLDAAIKALGADEFAEALSRFQPDAVFVDCELHAHIIVGLSLGLPVLQFSNMFLSPPSSRAPPLNKRIYPKVGLRGSRVGVSLLWISFLLWKLKKALRNKLKYPGAEYSTVLLELARRYDVPIAKKLRLVCWQMPWTYKIPTVLFVPQAVDLPTRPYRDFWYLGSMILQDRPEKPYDRAKVARFCSAKNEGGRIFVGFGSMMKPKGDLLANLWIVARRNPDWTFLFAAGKNWEDISSLDVPPNVDVVAWVPQQQVLEHADLAIMHGGTGGFLEAVEAATPMLLYPHVNDQEGSAARAVFHGIGRAGRRTDTADQIEADIRSLLTNPKYKTNCEKMQSACHREKATRDLADFLERVTNPKGG